MKVGVVGLGYVGLPLAPAFAQDGHEVLGAESDGRKVLAISGGEIYIDDVSDERLAAVRERFSASTSYEGLAECQAVMITVPTPLPRNREPDLGPLISAGNSLAGVLREG